MNRDIDIRQHAIIIKFDRGHEEVDEECIFEGLNGYDESIRIVLMKDSKGVITRIKVQNL